MELITFAALTETARLDALTAMTVAELNTLAMAAERDADHARFTARDMATVAIMGLIAVQARGEDKRRRVAARPAKQYTGCVAKENGRWVAA
jgi:hypothetical protein